MGFTFFNPHNPAPSRAKADHARFVQRIRRRYTPEREAFAQQAPGTPTEEKKRGRTKFIKTGYSVKAFESDRPSHSL